MKECFTQRRGGRRHRSVGSRGPSAATSALLSVPRIRSLGRAPGMAGAEREEPTPIGRSCAKDQPPEDGRPTTSALPGGAVRRVRSTLPGASVGRARRRASRAARPFAALRKASCTASTNRSGGACSRHRGGGRIEGVAVPFVPQTALRLLSEEVQSHGTPAAVGRMRLTFHRATQPAPRLVLARDARCGRRRHAEIDPSQRGKRRARTRAPRPGPAPLSERAASRPKAERQGRPTAPSCPDPRNRRGASRPSSPADPDRRAGGRTG